VAALLDRTTVMGAGTAAATASEPIARATPGVGAPMVMRICVSTDGPPAPAPARGAVLLAPGGAAAAAGAAASSDEPDDAAFSAISAVSSMSSVDMRASTCAISRQQARSTSASASSNATKDGGSEFDDTSDVAPTETTLGVRELLRVRDGSDDAASPPSPPSSPSPSGRRASLVEPDDTADRGDRCATPLSAHAPLTPAAAAAVWSKDGSVAADEPAAESLD
jgi:hypothetical protein